MKRILGLLMLVSMNSFAEQPKLAVPDVPVAPVGSASMPSPSMPPSGMPSLPTNLGGDITMPLMPNDEQLKLMKDLEKNNTVMQQVLPQTPKYFFYKDITRNESKVYISGKWFRIGDKSPLGRVTNIKESGFEVAGKNGIQKLSYN